MSDPSTIPTKVLAPRWYESFFGIDFALLHAAPVYYGLGVPHGDGTAVVTIPAFMHGDMYLLFMNAWLRRLGYQPFYSGIGFNADCPNLLIKDFVDHVVDEAVSTTGAKVHIIGHSLGGVIARSIAARRQNDVASVITLGSPLRRAFVHRAVARDAEAVRRFVVSQHSSRVMPECLTAECACDFITSLKRPVPTNIRCTAIYTRQDGLVEWESCTTGDADVDVEVPGTHTGLAFNPTVYRVIANRLAVAARD